MGRFRTIRIAEPVDIKTLLLHSIIGRDQNAVEAAVGLLRSHGPMLTDYFSISFDDGGALASLPEVVKDHLPESVALPAFLLALSRVDYSAERTCLQGISRCLAQFYCRLPHDNEVRRVDGMEEGGRGFNFVGEERGKRYATARLLTRIRIAMSDYSNLSVTPKHVTATAPQIPPALCARVAPLFLTCSSHRLRQARSFSTSFRPDCASFVRRDPLLETAPSWKLPSSKICTKSSSDAKTNILSFPARPVSQNREATHSWSPAVLRAAQPGS